MPRIGFVLLCLALVGCGSKKSGNKDEDGFSYENFSEQFRAATLPYQISDTGLLRNKDTATIRGRSFSAFISDSLKNRLFGKGSRVKYVTLGKLPASGINNFYVVKAVSGPKKAALLVVFDKDQFGGVMPLLVPDNDPGTSQQTVIDRTHTISKTVLQKKPDNSLAEGKEVYEYDGNSRQFALILTNPLNNENSEVINPIDTFSRKHKYAADYVKDKKNYVSVRDGRYPNQLLVFIHLDRNGGSCTGELKGDLLLTSPTTAIYRQGGDPCVLTFRFGPSSVMVREEEGCGSHRGLDCLFNGTFYRKKEARTKGGAKKK